MNNNKSSKGRTTILYLFASFFALIALFGAGYLISIMPERYLHISIVIGGAFVVLLILMAIIVNAVYSKRKIDGPSGPVLGSIMYDKINALNEPAFICDTHGKILWYNSFTQSGSGQKSPILGSYVTNFFPSSLTDEEAPLETVFNARNYKVERTKIRSGDKLYYLIVLRDITLTTSLKKFIKDNDKVAAYIIVDNLEELLQFEQEKYKEAATKIEELVREWAQSVGGILKEYERDKYIFIFNYEDLEKFKADKFDILDKVRDIRIGAGNIPVTISIGVAKIEGTLAEKEKAAHACLEMALQRGGDQAVVKIDNEVEFFGGRTTAAQKRTKVRARVVASELINQIAIASNVLIMAHKYPDYDAFGASMGIARLCKFCGVKFNVVTSPKDNNIVKCLRFFEGDDDYKGIFIDGAQGLDLVNSNTLLIVVDVNNISMFESADIARSVQNMVIIDHHRKTAEFENEPLISYIETSASSASELVSEMLEQVLPAETLKPNEANMLFAGISLDTKQFTKATGTKTYGAAMFLREHGASYDQVQDLFKTSLNNYKQESQFGELVEMYKDCIAIAVNKNGNDNSDRILGARVADNLLEIEGVKASFTLVMVESTVHISARSAGEINVQLILEELHGGGRFEAAGAQVQADNIDTVLIQLKQAIDKNITKEDDK